MQPTGRRMHAATDSSDETPTPNSCAQATIDGRRHTISTTISTRSIQNVQGAASSSTSSQCKQTNSLQPRLLVRTSIFQDMPLPRAQKNKNPPFPPSENKKRLLRRVIHRWAAVVLLSITSLTIPSLEHKTRHFRLVHRPSRGQITETHGPKRSNSLPPPPPPKNKCHVLPGKPRHARLLLRTADAFPRYEKSKIVAGKQYLHPVIMADFVASKIRILRSSLPSRTPHIHPAEWALRGSIHNRVSL